MKLFNTLILFLIPFISLAQSNYKPGYVVILQGDTVRGFIDYRGWDSNPTSISFKSSLSDSKPQLFTIGTIQLFNVNGISTYQKFTCRVSTDETNTSRLMVGKDSSSKTETIFLQVLEKGSNVALYAYTDNLKTRYYIGESPGFIPTELTYRIYENETNDATGQGAAATDNTYLKQLFAVANNYKALDDDLTRQFNKAGYNKDDLLVIVSKINGISKAEYVKKYADHSQFTLFISAALNVDNTSSSASSSYSAGGGKGYTSFGPAASFGLNIIPNAVTHKVEFRVELSVAQSQFSSLYQLKVSPYIPVKASFDQLDFSLAPQFIYNFYNTENTRAFFGFGINFTRFSFTNSFFGSQNPSVSDQGIGAAEPYFFSTYDTSFLLTAGVKFGKNFGAFLKYISKSNTTQTGYFQLNSSIEQAGITYFIGK